MCVCPHRVLHPFGEVLNVGWQANRCPTCRAISTKPVRVFLLEDIIDRYCENVYARLETEGKSSEAKKMKKERQSRVECVASL
jgi:hypothetical protein